MQNDHELQTIVERAKAYDKDALALIYERYFDRIYRYILVRVRRREIAEDLAGQTFLKLIERIADFEWRGPGFTGWIFRIAHNLLMDWFRQERDMPLVELPADIAEGPDTKVFGAESVREALKAIDGLKENQSQVLLLRLVAGLTGRETAEALDLSEANVRTLQHRALVILREKLREKIDV